MKMHRNKRLLILTLVVVALVAAIYFVMSYPLSLAVRYMERRLSFNR